MKQMILAIQTALQTASELSAVRDTDIYISPTDNYLPDTARTVAIGIVPGSEVRRELLGNRLESTRQIKVALFVSLLKPENGVIGDTNNPGIIDMTDHVDSVLHANFLGLPAIQSAFCKAMGEPTVFGSTTAQGRFIIRRTLTYEYELEVDAP